MTDILISEFINKEKLKEQLINNVWKRDREPKRKLFINLEVNDLNKIIDKTKKKKKWQKKTGVQRNMK